MKSVSLQHDAAYYSKKAESLFAEGYNCSQAVLLAFADECGLTQETAALLASSFGGGMGRLREVCGAVSGMFMVAGLCCGYDDPHANTEKADHYARIQKLASAFTDENGSIICRTLLGLQQTGASVPQPEQRTAAYYQKRPCKALVGDAAHIVATALKAKCE